MFYVHRYIRLTVPLMLVISFLIAFLPLIGQSTNSQGAHYLGLQQSVYCRDYGWSVLLYVNNFIKGGNECVGVTWYTSNDMIFFWISLLIIYPMWSNPRTGALIWWFIWLVAATIPITYQTWRFKLGIDGSIRYGISDPSFHEDAYRVPWTRFQPYLIGILTGYILHHTRDRSEISIKPILNVICWQAAFLTAFAVVYGLYEEFEGLSNLEYTLYNGFQRIGWSLAVSWVIVSCCKGIALKRKEFFAEGYYNPPFPQ